jgi:hypothetical protein
MVGPRYRQHRLALRKCNRHRHNENGSVVVAAS